MACDDAASVTALSLAAAAAGPAEMSSDAGSVRQHPLPDLIAAANYLAGVCAASTPHRGLRFNRLTPGGSVQRPPGYGGGGGWGGGWGFDRYRNF